MHVTFSDANPGAETQKNLRVVSLTPKPLPSKKSVKTKHLVFLSFSPGPLPKGARFLNTGNWRELPLLFFPHPFQESLGFHFFPMVCLELFPA